MYNPARKFEDPKIAWRDFQDRDEKGAYWVHLRLAHCGSDPLCRPGRARFQIVQFMHLPGWNQSLPFGDWRKDAPRPKVGTPCSP